MSHLLEGDDLGGGGRATGESQAGVEKVIVVLVEVLGISSFHDVTDLGHLLAIARQLIAGRVLQRSDLIHTQ